MAQQLNCYSRDTFQAQNKIISSELTLLSLCSVLVQASMKVCERTCSEASTTSVAWMSKMKCGFLRMFTQKRISRLRMEGYRISLFFLQLMDKRAVSLQRLGSCWLVVFNLFVFQMCNVSSSTLSCLSACSSKKSKKYFTAGGTTELEHNTQRKKSSTNCCNVPCVKKKSNVSQETEQEGVTHEVISLITKLRLLLDDRYRCGGFCVTASSA